MSSHLFISESIEHSYIHFISATGSCKFNTWNQLGMISFTSLYYIQNIRTCYGTHSESWYLGNGKKKSWTSPQTSWRNSKSSSALTWICLINEILMKYNLRAYYYVVSELFIPTLMLYWKGTSMDPCSAGRLEWFVAVEISE